MKMMRYTSILLFGAFAMSCGAPDEVQKKNFVSLKIAIEKNDYKRIEDLLKNRISDSMKRKYQYNLLLSAVLNNKPDVLKILLRTGCGTGDRNELGENILFTAVEVNSIGCVQVLLDSGIDPNQSSDNGRTAIYNVIGEKVFRALIRHGALLDIKDTFHKSPSEYAKGLKRMYVVEWMEREFAKVKKR